LIVIFLSQVMKKYILLNLVIILSLSAYSQTIEWAKSEPYNSYITYTNIVIHDNFGNSFIAGSYYQSGVSGIFIVKYDINGNKLWEKAGYGSASSMSTDTSGNLYTSGGLFAKYDPDGNLLWIKHLQYQLWLSEQTDAQDNLIANGYVTGYIEDTVHLENGVTLTTTLNGYNLFIGCYNTNGECLWAIPDEGGNRNIICNANAEIYIKAEIGVDSVILGKGLKQITLYSSNGLTYIAKYAQNGELIWAKQVNSYEIAPDNSGNLYSFSGDANGNTYLDKYDVNGNLLWKRTHLLIADWYKSAMKCNTNGDIYITGGFRGLMTIDDTTITGNGHYHVFVAKIDSSGTLKWITTTGGTGGAGAKDITIANGNEIYITGDIGGVNIFGATTLNEPGGVFIAKIIDYDVSTTIKDFPKSNTIFNVYPNPSGSVFNIQYENYKAVGNIQLTVTSIQGNSVYNESINDFNGKLNKQINLHNIAKGTYFVELNSDKTKEMKKIIVE
jgi:hypothetical protein